MKNYCLLIFFSLLLSVVISCKTKNPGQELLIEETFDTLPASNTNPEKLNAFIADADAPNCSRIPSQAEVNNGQWSFTDHFYTAGQAIKMGIPVVNINGSHNLRVYVKDYRRVASCLGIDSTTVLYGQIIRTVIELEDYDASVGVDLASIAANGTLKRNSQHFFFYKDGFYNPKIDSIIVTVQGKEFDVQNYSLFQNIMGDMINLLRQPGTTFSPSRIGVQETLGDEQEMLTKSPLIAYALSSICNRICFNKAKNKFLNNRFAMEIMENTYRMMECSLDNEEPSQTASAKAKKLLQGIKVKK